MYKYAAILAVLCGVISTPTSSQTAFNSTYKVPADAHGNVALPITDGAYWFISNECNLSRSGWVPELNSSVSYRINSYGDLFYLQQFTGEGAAFVENLIYLSQVNATCSELKSYRETKIPDYTVNIDKQRVAQSILDFQFRFKETVSYPELIGRIPNNGACPNARPTTSADRARLENCLDMTLILKRVVFSGERLRDSSVALDSAYTTRAYVNRKKYNEATVKASYGYMFDAGIWTTNAYISIYPASYFPVRENYTFLDRISLDVGLAKPNGNVSEKFDSADHYMYGIAFDLSETFSISVAGIQSRYKDGSKDTDVALSLSFDLLNAISK